MTLQADGVDVSSLSGAQSAAMVEASGRNSDPRADDDLKRVGAVYGCGRRRPSRPWPASGHRCDRLVVAQRLTAPYRFRALRINGEVYRDERLW